MKLLLLSLVMIFAGFSAYAQDTTTVEVTLALNDKDRLPVKVYAPEKVAGKRWTFVIPRIIPGTYMRINYRKAYHDFEAFDTEGRKLNVKRKDNHIIIKEGENPLDYLTYQVEESVDLGPVWDRILGCAATIYTDSSFLLNFQQVNGYFKGYSDTPFKHIFLKNSNLYGAGSLKRLMSSESRDVFAAANYGELIDNPMLFAKADTASVSVGSNIFKIAVHAEKGHVQAEKLKPAISRIMHAIDTFSGFTTEKDYHFLLYYIDYQRLNGMMKSFGLGSALEHKSSSVYYYSDLPTYDSTFSILDWIGVHEYYHTIAPLNLHSEKIYNFNFDEPDMSRHGWLYEGVTDYFSALVNEQSNEMSQPFERDILFAIQSANKRKPRSFTESSRNIIKGSIFNWISKINQLGDFYVRGKMVAFWLDMELMERSNGERRLIDVMLEMKKDYEGSYIEDAKLLDVLTQYTYPELRNGFAKYIEGEELVPYDAILKKFGWNYIPAGTKMPSYGKLNYRYSFDRKLYYIKKTGSNTLGLKKGDYVLRVNGISFDSKEAEKKQEAFKLLWRPDDPSKEVVVVVERDGQELTLKGRPEKQRKIKWGRMVEDEELTPQQIAYRERFFKRSRL